MIRSFIEVEPESHFPIHNLPYGVFRDKENKEPRIGVAIGEFVLDLAVLDEHGFFDSTGIGGKRVFRQASLNPFMQTGKKVWKEVRSIIQHLLKEDVPTLRDNWDLRNQAFKSQKDIELMLPVEIKSYTDFYASKEHAANVGTIFRGKEKALMPNWIHLPVGYHGRASSVVVSGTDIYRPQGQTKPLESDQPIFGPSKQLDFELEVGYFIGIGNELGSPISVKDARDHVFGFVLVNDWSARDIQSWEYQPLGPFLSKNFATSISPWVVPLEALEPFRVKGSIQDPEPLSYLKVEGLNSFDIHLEVFLKSKNMEKPQRISKSNYKYLYWSIEQQIAHHTITGCNLQTGDLMATGTISGPTKESRGCLLELTWRGKEPIQLDNGEQRIWIEDGDEVIMTGWCQGDGYRIGFGEVRGRILPPKELDLHNKKHLSFSK